MKREKIKHLQGASFLAANIPPSSRKNKIIKHYLKLISLKTCG
ncbi:TPA: hypothetical protein ACGZ5U_004368 [Escherichia coli]|nr:hypothetical protein [Escherichia coli]MCV0926307.1 hypothetical protein [Escherichia coli]